ncbi:MAG: carboxylesterase family protein [Proteobacteria bacterium]|nr:carboxylesterase family protein [Pseudomonadota bacterium]
MATSGWLAATSLLVGCGGPRPGPIIDTKSGPVQGQVIDGIHQYLGIPYAEPPLVCSGLCHRGQDLHGKTYWQRSNTV